MAPILVLYAAVAFLHLGSASQVSSTVSKGQLTVQEPSFQVDASGKIHSAQALQHHSSPLAELVQRMKEAVAAKRPSPAHIMRSEVRRDRLPRSSFPSIDEAMGLLEVSEVDCSASGIDSDNPMSRKFCHILEGGTNAQVAGKLERAVKGLSLRPKNGNSTEMEVADKTEEALLDHLRAAMWDLWFCAKRTEPCDARTSQEPKVKAAREGAFDALRAIHMHAEVDKEIKKEATLSSPALEQKEAQPSSLLEKASAADDPVTEPTEEAGAAAPIEAAGSSEAARAILSGILDHPEAHLRTTKIFEAINIAEGMIHGNEDLGIAVHDEEGHMQALKDAMLKLHECALMPQCPGENCCNPKQPTQQVYIDAQHAGITAYAEILKDNSEAAKKYREMLATVQPGPPAGAAAKKEDPTTAAEAPAEISYPPDHPLHNPDKAVPINVTEVLSPPPVAEGSLLYQAMGALLVVVLMGIAFLYKKTAEMSSGGGGGGGAKAAAEDWGEEGEGYGDY